MKISLPHLWVEDGKYKYIVEVTFNTEQEAQDYYLETLYYYKDK